MACQYADEIFNLIFLTENVLILIKISPMLLRVQFTILLQYSIVLGNDLASRRVQFTILLQYSIVLGNDLASNRWQANHLKNINNTIQ